MKRLVYLICILAAGAANAQAPLTTVPFTLHGDHIFVQLSVDHSDPLDFIFDTGDGLTVLDLNVAQDLGLDLKHVEYHESVQGLISGAIIKHNTLELNGMLMEKNIKVYSTSLNHLEISIGRNVDGIVGWDLLRHHPVTIDWDNNVIEVYADGDHPKLGTPIPFKLVNSIPTIEATTVLNNGESITGTYFVNTGAGTSMDFNTPFAKANNIADKTGEHYSYLIKGLGDVETKHFEGRLKSFDMGGHVFNDIPIGISESMSGLQGDPKVAGIIGSRFLRQMNMVLDYSNNTIYFSENSLYGKKIPVNCSGLDVQMTEDKSGVLIHQVYEGSPAADAGVKQNDQLVSIDGKSAMEMGLIGIEEALKEIGATVELVIKSGGSEKTITITLKELI